MTLHPSPGPDWDDVFRALADGKRRRLFLALWERGPETDMVPLRDIPALSTEHDRLELRHVHLPMLEGMGYVRWDRDRGAVGRGPRYEEVLPAVEWLHERRSLDRTA